MSEPRPDPRRAIPSVDRLLAAEPFAALVADAPEGLLLDSIRAVQEEVRGSLERGEPAPVGLADPAWYAGRVRDELARRRLPSLRRVINATGVVLHTNLGRAPLAPAALAAIERVARSYSNLEYDLELGARGSRYLHCAALLRELTGAEAALVVNNNAAALVLALNTLARGREAVISRGELVEIGGSFRVPDIMARSGAEMVEVGTTNKTHLVDYRDALTARSGAILKVHRSNFRMRGFTADAPAGELAALARERGVPLIHDLGSGLLIDPGRAGLPPEPTAADALREGADLVTMSGDKALGGPQAGLILGRAELVERMRANPLCRALRVDKLTLAALEATLTLYREPERARREIPALVMLSASAEEIAARAEALAPRLREAGFDAEPVDGASAVGGGAFPDAELPTRLISLRHSSLPAGELAARLRAGEPAVIAFIREDRVLLDLRTVAREEEEELAVAVERSGAA